MNFKCLLTDAGNAIAFTALVNGGNIEFSKVEIGSGKQPSAEQATTLAQKKIDGQFLSISKNDDNSATINFCFDNKNVTEQFNFTEFAIYAKYTASGSKSAESEVLYAYGYTLDETGETIPTFTNANSYVKENIFLTFKIGSPDSLIVNLGEYEDYANKAAFEKHTADIENPHKVTAKQVGLGNVENISINNAAPTFVEANKFENIISGEKASVLWGKVKKMFSELSQHMTNSDNPHGVIWSQIYKKSQIPLPISLGGTGETSISNFKKILNQDVVVDLKDKITLGANTFNLFGDGFWRQNNTAFIFATFQISKALGQDEECLLMTLPNEICPPQLLIVHGQTSIQTENPSCSIKINPDGKVMLYSFGIENFPANTFFRFQAIYPLNS